MNDQENLETLNIRLGVLHQDVGEVKAVLSKLTEAITKLALIEQQQGQTALSVERVFREIEKITLRSERTESRVAAIETQLPVIVRTNVWVERFLIAAAAAAVVFVAKAAGLFGG